MEQSLIEDISHEIVTGGEKGKVLYMASGGSSIPISVAVLRSIPPPMRSRVTVTLTDERFGPVGHDDSNWKQLIDKGFDAEGFRLLPTLSAEMTARDRSAASFEEKLRVALAHSDTVIALFGIGTDHHIAGILPGSDAVRVTERFVAAYDAETFERITITPPVFSNIDKGFIYAKGESKREAIDALAKEHSFIEYPNQLIKQCGTYAVMFVP